MGKWIEPTILKEEVQMVNKYMKIYSTSLAIKEMQTRRILP
jgi:hypothetical protein